MIDHFVENNYDSLNRIASAYCIMSQMPSNDLVLELVIYLYDNEKKVIAFISDDTSLMRFSKRWMWNQVNVYTKNTGLSNFKSKFQLFDGPDVGNQVVEWEGTNFSLRDEYEFDLSRHYTDEQIDKIVFTYEYIKKLDEIDKRLFDLHYAQKMSHIQIAHYLQKKYNQKVSPSSVYNMIVKLRKKIKEAYDNI